LDLALDFFLRVPDVSYGIFFMSPELVGNNFASLDSINKTRFARVSESDSNSDSFRLSFTALIALISEALIDLPADYETRLFSKSARPLL
jgi:hypothetical protein